MPRPTPRSLLLVNLGLLSAFGPMSTDLYLPGLPHIGRELGATDAQTQLTLSTCMIGLAVGQLFAGPLSDRFGRRRPLIIGLVIFTLTSALAAASGTIWVLWSLRLLQGLSGAAGLVIGRAIVRDLYAPEETSKVFSTLTLVSGSAPVLSPLCGSALLHVMSWRGLFLVLGGIGAVVLIMSVVVLPESLAVADRHTGGLRQLGRVVHEVTTERMFLGTCCVMGLASAALFTYISLSSFVLEGGFGLTQTEFTLIFAVNSLGIVLAGRLNIRALRRRDPLTLLRFGTVVMAAGTMQVLLAAAFGWGLLGLLPGLFFVVSMVGIVMPNATGIALRWHPRNAGTASALLGALQFGLGAIVGGIAAAVSATELSMGWFMVAAGLGAALVYQVILRPARIRMPGSLVAAQSEVSASQP